MPVIEWIIANQSTKLLYNKFMYFVKVKLSLKTFKWFGKFVSGISDSRYKYLYKNTLVV